LWEIENREKATMIFDDTFRARLLELFVWRRDVRRFRPDPLPPETLERLIHIACLAPSVGLSQPWRFIIVDNPMRRQAIADMFRVCNAEALASYTSDTASHYARLKLSAIEDAPAQLTVFADYTTKMGRGLGRNTMPEMIEYSVVAAVHTMWLAARAEGIGLGWVSILDPSWMAEIVDVPLDWRFIGHLCLGYPELESERPELERAEWEYRTVSSKAIIRR
jgi:5,6-dimethylbenzimidazole synthase